MAERIVTPIGDLKWIFITGSGKKDLNDNDRFVASVSYPESSAEAKAVTKMIDDFWEENKPKGRKQKSKGIAKEFYPRSHEKAGEETGNILVNFWTGIVYPDGSPKVIKTMNAKGVEVALGGRKIGNGSRGAISGAMAIYDNGPAACGVTLYLNAVQLTKFVEYTDDAGFAAVEDEDAFTGEELNSDGFTPVADNAATDTATPSTDAPRVSL